MAKIIVIPANGKAKKTTETVQDLRVAAYCRVSTDTDEQATSYETQVDHYTHYIEQHPGWCLAGIYADDGISGTNTKKRSEFNRLIDDCMAGRVDMIITKSISRFARNTLDCLKYIRQLKEKEIPVFFEKENINTLDAKGEVLLTIMASLAQQESQSLSQNVKLGLQYRFQQGKVMVGTNRFLGYDKDEDGHLIVNREEAKVIKRIYREFLEGWGYNDIAKHLQADGIRTGANKKKWLGTTVRKILMNEKYIGDALLQKTVTVDFLNKRRVINKGLAPQYYVENDHEAIIPKDIFQAVQEEIYRRYHTVTATGRRRVFSGKYALSSIVYCAHCGDIFRRIQWPDKDKGKCNVWRCCTRLDGAPKGTKPCTARTVSEELLHQVIVTALNQILLDKDRFLQTVQDNLKQVIGMINEQHLQQIEKELQGLQQELLKRVSKKKAFDDVTRQMDALEEKKKKYQKNNADNKEIQRRMNLLIDFLEKQDTQVTEYDEMYVRRLIEKVTVYDDHFEVEFKSGLMTTVNL